MELELTDLDNLNLISTLEVEVVYENYFEDLKGKYPDYFTGANGGYSYLLGVDYNKNNPNLNELFSGSELAERKKLRMNQYYEQNKHNPAMKEWKSKYLHLIQ